MFLFERKISLPSKDKVPQVRKQFKVDKNIANIPHDILIQLFINSISMIEENNKYLSSEYKSLHEQMSNKQKIIDDLFEELEEKIDLGVYK